MSMINGMLTVKEYAEKQGKSVQSVYKQIRGKEKAVALDGHIHLIRVNNRMIRLLDEEAIRVLDEASKQSVQIVEQSNDRERIEELERENKALLIKISELQDALISEQKDVQRLQNEKMELLATRQNQEQDSADEKLKEERKKWWQFWK